MSAHRSAARLRRLARDPIPLLTAPPAPGHNGGPALDAPLGDWNYYCWRRAHRAAWKTPPREIALRRLRRAEELGMSYREYTLVILDKGKFL